MSPPMRSGSSAVTAGRCPGGTASSSDATVPAIETTWSQGSRSRDSPRPCSLARWDDPRGRLAARGERLCCNLDRVFASRPNRWELRLRLTGGSFPARPPATAHETGALGPSWRADFHLVGPPCRSSNRPPFSSSGIYCLTTWLTIHRMQHCKRAGVSRSDRHGGGLGLRQQLRGRSA
jgi:hypothetical protein